MASARLHIALTGNCKTCNGLNTMGIRLTCARGIWGSGLHSAQGAAGWEVSQETPGRPGMSALHGAQTCTALPLLCGVGDLSVTGSGAALQGQHTGLCVPAHAEGTVPVLGEQTEHCTKCCRIQRNGDGENWQQHFVLLPSSCISSIE